MTTERKLARWIADVVVRLALPGAKDWARATARELESIPNDWAALVWAAGSLRILFRWSRVPLANLSEVPCAARELVRRTRAAMLLGSAIALFEATAFSYYLVHFRSHPVLCAGSILTAAGALWFGYRSIVRRGRKVPCGETLLVAGAYRAELERQRDFLAVRRLCTELGPLVAGVSVFCIGMILTYPKTARIDLSSMSIMLIASLIAGLGYRSCAAGYQRRIEELDALIEKSGGGSVS